MYCGSARKIQNVKVLSTEGALTSRMATSAARMASAFGFARDWVNVLATLPLISPELRRMTSSLANESTATAQLMDTEYSGTGVILEALVVWIQQFVKQIVQACLDALVCLSSVQAFGVSFGFLGTATYSLIIRTSRTLVLVIQTKML